MISICKVCDLPVKLQNIQVHMNRAHMNRTCSQINECEMQHRAPYDTYAPDRWLDGSQCSKHFMGASGLRLHMSRIHKPASHNLRTSPVLFTPSSPTPSEQSSTSNPIRETSIDSLIHDPLSNHPLLGDSPRLVEQSSPLIHLSSTI